MDKKKDDVKSIKVYKFNNMKENWHEFALKFRVIADSRGYDGIIDGAETPPDEKEIIEILADDKGDVLRPKTDKLKATTAKKKGYRDLVMSNEGISLNIVENQGTFAAIKRAENYLPLQPFFNNTHFGQTLINCIHNQHRLGIPDEYFMETCINTYTQNGFVTKELVKIDKDSQTQDYTIIYIRFQGQTPPFSTHNRDIFERLLPTPFPQVGHI